MSDLCLGPQAKTSKSPLHPAFSKDTKPHPPANPIVPPFKSLCVFILRCNLVNKERLAPPCTHTCPAQEHGGRRRRNTAPGPWSKMAARAHAHLSPLEATCQNGSFQSEATTWNMWGRGCSPGREGCPAQWVQTLDSAHRTDSAQEQKGVQFFCT